MLDKNKNKGAPKPYLRNLNVRWFDFDLSDVLEMRFEDGERERYTARKGDLLICEGGYPGRAAIWEDDEPIYFQKAIHRVRFHEPERAKWFLYYLQLCDIDGSLRSHFTGAGIQHFTGEALKRFCVPLPPLPEQQRIVAILEEVFAGLATTTANAEKNLKSARELFESCLNSVFTNTNDWLRSPISRLTTKIGSGATPKGGEKSYKKQGIPLIRSLNVYDRRFKIDELAYLDNVQAKKLEGVTVQSGDVLLNITGASVARCCLAPEEFLPARVNQHVSIVRPIPAAVLPRFLEFGLTAKVNKDRLLGVGENAGATRQAITKAQIQEFEFSFPTLDAQSEIITKLNGIGAETEKLEAHYRAKLKSLAELKQSILQKAFSGELTSPPSQAIKEAAE